MPKLKLDDILNFVQGLSDNSLLNIIFCVKTLVVSTLFLVLVSLWDTLVFVSPVLGSSAPTYKVLKANSFVVDSSPQISIVVDYKYVVQKLVDFEIHYELINEASGLVIHDIDRAVAPTKLSHKIESFQKIFVISERGVWCLHAKLIWTNGLSIRSHVEELPKLCFDV